MARCHARRGAPGPRGQGIPSEGGERMDNGVEPDSHSEIKLVRVSGGTSRARFIKGLGWFVN